MDVEDWIAVFEGAADALRERHATEEAVARSPDALLAVLQGIGRINRSDKRGATQVEASEIAKSVGYDARGLAGLYTKIAGYLRMDDSGGRWVTEYGWKYLKEHRK
jgi:hypothetical protein